jgi:hypothetical protein
MIETAKQSLLEVLSKCDSPFTYRQLNKEFLKFCEERTQESNDPSPSAVQGDFKRFLLDMQEKLFESLNIPFVREIGRGFISKAYDLPVLQFEDFCPKSKDPEYDEVSNLIQKIYTEVSTTQSYREEAEHYQAVLKNVESYLKSFKTAMRAFVMDMTILPTAFVGVAERDRFFKNISADIEVYLELVQRMIKDIAKFIDSVLSVRYNLLMRADSAIRLLSKFLELDAMGNRGGSRPRTRPMGNKGQGVDLSGFSVEKVNGS